MIGWDVIAPFLLATLVLSLTPGPATALVIRQSALHGIARTVPVILGAGLGVYAWAMLAALGVAGVVAASPAAFTVLKVLGAVVLLVLGIQAWRHSFRHDDEIVGSAKVPGGWRGFGTGALTNLANPKVMVFCLAFFPQFIPVGADPISTTAQLAAISVLIDALYCLSLALAAHSARRFFARRKVRAVLDRLSGSVFIGLAARMATLTR